MEKPWPRGQELIYFPCFPSGKSLTLSLTFDLKSKMNSFPKLDPV